MKHSKYSELHMFTGIIKIVFICVFCVCCWGYIVRFLGLKQSVCSKNFGYLPLELKSVFLLHPFWELWI